MLTWGFIITEGLDWLGRVKHEDAVQLELQGLLAASRRRRAKALADGIEHMRTAAAVGRLLDPAITGQAVAKFIRENPPQTAARATRTGEHNT
ncbi:hypothetical protein [Actinacidiphila glaucinigra]|uniref:hypothetical protein n=1 Tax=Actinacidiphila glaucinigra TaxID=235986 RepID=UPI003D8D3D92